jgi:hypothetical protein
VLLEEDDEDDQKSLVGLGTLVRNLGVRPREGRGTSGGFEDAGPAVEFVLNRLQPREGRGVAGGIEASRLVARFTSP